jgi:hypothetical protein
MADTTSNRIRLIGLLPVVALAAGYLAGRHRSVDAVSDVAASAARDDGSPATPPRTMPVRVRVSPAPPREVPATPADNLPLAQSFEALAVRARAGDAVASMRLFREVRRCQERPMLESISNGPQAGAEYADSLPESMREHVLADIRESRHRREHASSKLAASQAACAGVTQAEIATLGEWLERAADSGDPGAAYCYVLSGTTDAYAPAERYSDEWVEWMERYRSKAHDYAEFAFSHGYQGASWYLYWVAAGPYAMPAFQVDHDIPRDYARAYAIALLQTELVERNANRDEAAELADWQDSADRLSAALDDAAIARAKAWANAEAVRLAAHPPPEPPCSDGNDS